MEVLIVIAVFFTGLLILFIVLAIIRNSKKTKKAAELKSIDRVNIGKYLTGLPSADSPELNVDCVITADRFIFISAYGREFGSIKRNSINQIIVDDKSKISQRLTATRLLTLGIFSLATPKKTKTPEFCVAIDWDDASGIKNNTVFEFTQDDANQKANKAANTLKKYVQMKAEIIRPDEMKCPYCAEIVKKEAKICKHCHKDL